MYRVGSPFFHLSLHPWLSFSAFFRRCRCFTTFSHRSVVARQMRSDLRSGLVSACLFQFYACKVRLDVTLSIVNCIECVTVVVIFGLKDV